MTPYQAPFGKGLLDPEAPAPKTLCGPKGAPAGRRYDVYRNNVTHGLITALGTAFPLVRKLLGRAQFDQLAPQYVRAHPPRSAMMMQYGADFPTFLEAFEPLNHLGYLPDCARLDVEMRQSYHAATVLPFDRTQLAEDPETANLCLAPATRVLRSHWPLYDIWAFNQTDGAPQPGAAPQDVLITRPSFDPQVQPLPPGAADWLMHLTQGLPLGAALDATLEMHPEFDLTAALTLALSSGAFADPPSKDS